MVVKTGFNVCCMFISHVLHHVAMLASISMIIRTDTDTVMSKDLACLVALNSSSVICIALCYGRAGKLQIIIKVCGLHALLIDNSKFDIN